MELGIFCSYRFLNFSLIYNIFGDLEMWWEGHFSKEPFWLSPGEGKCPSQPRHTARLQALPSGFGRLGEDPARWTLWTLNKTLGLKMGLIWVSRPGEKSNVIPSHASKSLPGRALICQVCYSLPFIIFHEISPIGDLLRLSCSCLFNVFKGKMIPFPKGRKEI